MKKFFKTTALIHQFTMELDRHRDTLKCKHCLKQAPFVSHGFVYKKGNYSAQIKRLFSEFR